MTEQSILKLPTTLPGGTIIAADIPSEVYMQRYAGQHCEWVRGDVIQMSPTNIQHNRLVHYLLHLLSAYFELRPVGVVQTKTFVMRLDAVQSQREPDVFVVLGDNRDNLTDTAMVGPADICMEVVSPESSVRDHGEKFDEYEKGGVREYWIIDPTRKSCRFNRLDAAGTYQQIVPAADAYTTPLLPHLVLHIPTLWRDPLPGLYAVGDAVRAMLEGTA